MAEPPVAYLSTGSTSTSPQYRSKGAPQLHLGLSATHADCDPLKEQQTGRAFFHPIPEIKMDVLRAFPVLEHLCFLGL